MKKLLLFSVLLQVEQASDTETLSFWCAMLFFGFIIWRLIRAAYDTEAPKIATGWIVLAFLFCIPLGIALCIINHYRQ